MEKATGVIQSHMFVLLNETIRIPWPNTLLYYVS